MASIGITFLLFLIQTGASEAQFLGTWYLNVDGAANNQTSFDRATLSLYEEHGVFTGEFVFLNESDKVGNITFNDTTSTLEFCRLGPAPYVQW